MAAGDASLCLTIPPEFSRYGSLVDYVLEERFMADVMPRDAVTLSTPTRASRQTPSDPPSCAPWYSSGLDYK